MNLIDHAQVETMRPGYDYDAFGNEKNPSATDTNPFRYCGEYFDKETGTYYLRARYYDPSIGRFTQQDSVQYTEKSLPTGNITDPLSLNYYTYSANNPIYYCDPSGNAWETVLDVVSLVESTATLIADPSIQNALFFTWDAASAVLPFIPGSYIAKGVKWFGKADDAIDAVKAIDNTVDVLDNAAKKEKVLGQWVDVNESMSTTSRKYQTFITGQTNKAYLVNGVKFDGITPDGVLIDAKGRYSQFLDEKGNFKPWFTGDNGFVGQANRQIEAAKGTPITWYFLEEKVMNATVNLFVSNGITEIKCIYMPF